MPLAYVLAWVGVYSLPRRMFNIGGDNGIEPWILLAIFFIGLPLFLRFILKQNGFFGDTLKAIVYGSVFLAIPFVILIHSEDNEELKKYGVQTTGVIDKAWLVTQKNRGSTWSVKAKYVVNGICYHTTTQDDDNKTLQYGDTVVVIYSSKTPEMSEIKELKEYYKK